MSNPEFKDRYGPWALVTGASAGIGAEFARQLAARDLNVILVARRTDPLETLAAQLEREFGVDTRTISVDLTEQAFMEKIRRAVGDVEVSLLVNNAGTAVRGGFLDGDLEPERRMVELNVVAPLVLAHELGREMQARGRGGIMFVSSPIGLQGVPTFTNYPATKSYNLTLAEGLAHELKQAGIDVLTVLPGPTLTEGTATMGAEANEGPMKFGPPEGVVKATLAALGKRSTVVPGAMNRVMTAFAGAAMSRSARTKMWAQMLSKVGVTGDLVSSPQARTGVLLEPQGVSLDE